jgi:DNA-binding transcriptional MerR regulator
MASEKYTVQQLRAAAGVSARTLRHWTKLNLLPKPLGRGRAARYEESHLIRAQVIRQLRGVGASLPEIKKRLTGLSEQAVRALLTPEASAAYPGGVPLSPPEPSYPFTSWEVVQLTAGLVLMVDAQRGPSVRRLASEIYKYFGAPATNGSTR